MKYLLIFMCLLTGCATKEEWEGCVERCKPYLVTSAGTNNNGMLYCLCNGSQFEPEE